MLIVDDIEVNRASLASCFMNEYVIKETVNGLEGWEYLEENFKLQPEHRQTIPDFLSTGLHRDKFA